MDTTPDPMDRSPARPDVIPADLDGWEPGPFLAAVLSTVDLAPLCRHHHQLKDRDHKTNWSYTIHPDGTITWTSPLDHTYTTNGQSP